MENAVKSVDKLEVYLANQALQGIASRDRRELNPQFPSNISNLFPKTMQTNTDIALECRQNYTIK